MPDLFKALYLDFMILERQETSKLFEFRDLPTQLRIIEAIDGQEIVGIFY